MTHLLAGATGKTARPTNFPSGKGDVNKMNCLWDEHQGMSSKVEQMPR